MPPHRQGGGGLELKNFYRAGPRGAARSTNGTLAFDGTTEFQRFSNLSAGKANIHFLLDERCHLVSRNIALDHEDRNRVA
jgi:hypothetical protein